MADPPRIEEKAADRPGLQVDDVTEGLARAVRLIRDPDSAAEAVLEQAGLDSHAEAVMITEIADLRPLAHPDRFAEAYALAMRALEVYDREGYGHPRIPGWLGPFRAIVRLLVVRFAKFVVRSYTKDCWRAIRKLVARREGQARAGSDERVLLRRARVHCDTIGPEFSGGSLGVPGFLIGAVLPLFASLTGIGSSELFGNVVLVAVGAILAAFAVAGLAWVVLHGTAIAHRRATVALEKPLAALWETIGNAGRPPTDDGATFAIFAIVAMALLWIVIPAAIGLAILFG